MLLLVGVVLTNKLALKAQEIGERLVKLEKLADCLLIIDNAYRGFEEVQKFLPQSEVIIKRSEIDESDGKSIWEHVREGDYVDGRCLVIRNEKCLKKSTCYNFVLEYSRLYEYGWALIMDYVPSSPDIVSTSKEVATANERLGVVCSQILHDSFIVLTNVFSRAENERLLWSRTSYERACRFDRSEGISGKDQIYENYGWPFWGFISPNNNDDVTFWHNKYEEDEALFESQIEWDEMKRAAEKEEEKYLREQSISDGLDSPPSDAFDSYDDYIDWTLQ